MDAFTEIAPLMFQLEEQDREAATKLTMGAIRVANWPYSQSGLGFGDPREWTPAMKRHAPVLLRNLKKALSHPT